MIEPTICNADEARRLLTKHLDATGWTVSQCASRVTRSESERGIHRNGAYEALRSRGQRRMGTILNLLRAAGFEVEILYRIKRRPEQGPRPSLHMN